MVGWLLVNLHKQKPKKSKHVRRLIITAVIGIGLLVGWQNLQHLQQTADASELPHEPAFSVNPSWPENVAAAAVGAEGYGVLAAHGEQEKRPIASIAKVITALALLDKYPLQAGEEGPSIPISDRDEQLYRDYVAQNGTVVLIKAGVPISLRDALEAMLLPSANNIADTAAMWGFGSLEEYHRYTNELLARYGLKDTVVGGDASGLSPETKSTASDLVRIGELALNNPVIAEIVAQESAEIPFAGPIPNYNALVTKHGFTGIKPGDTLEAGITSLFSTKQEIDGEQVTLIGVILGAGTYAESNNAAVQIVESVKTSARRAVAGQ